MKRILSLLLSLIIVLSICITPVLATETIVENDTPLAERIDVSAYAAIVVDMASGEVLYEHDADEINAPASTTKIMTAYLALKHGDLDDMITVSSDAFGDLGTLASTWDTVVGEEMTVRRALQALLVVSASECANVLGEYVSGDRTTFVDLMNEEAQALGCTNTHFMNCHGLPRTEHYTTARDLATIAMAAMEYEEFREIVGSAVTVLEATNVHGEQHITSTNGILPGSSYPKYNYPYAIGIKTGHTSVAGYCLVSAANKDGKELLCVVMGCGSRESSFAQTIKLYDWAYENYDILMWDTNAHTAEEAALEEVLEEAPEYEEVEASVSDEEEVILVDEVGEPLPEESLVSSESQASVMPETVPVVSAPVDPPSEASAETVEVSASALEIFTGPMLPVLICFAIALCLLLILVIVLIVMLSRRSKQHKKAKKKKSR